MKKLLALMLALMMVLSLCACGQSEEPADDNTDVEETVEWAYDEYMTEEQWAELAAFYVDWSVMYEQMMPYAENENVMASENGPAVIERVQTYEETITAMLEDPSLFAEADEDFDTFMGELNSLLDNFNNSLPLFEQLAEG